MKKLLVVLGLSMYLSVTLHAQMTIEKVFLPEGFDKNDVAQVVIQGNFSDGCYQLDNESVSLDTKNKKINIHLNYHHPENTMCIQMVSPFTKTINLGLLSEGDYQVHVEGFQRQGKLTIKPASSENTDDYIYAPVEFTEVQELSSGAISITMKGRYPLQKRGCMRLKNTVTKSQKDIIVIQPIAEIKDDQYCRENPTSQNFSHIVTVPSTEKGQALVYVRVLNGGSYSRVFNLH